MEEFIIIAVIVAIIAAFSIIIIRFNLRNENDNGEGDDEQLEKTDDQKNLEDEVPQDEALPERVEVYAEVVDMSCGSRIVGTKNPKAIREFFVSFEREDLGVLRLSVSEEVYVGFEIGQKGILTTVEGELYSFALDEKK